jgi:HK97 family phage portal protein
MKKLPSFIRSRPRPKTSFRDEESFWSYPYSNAGATISPHSSLSISAYYAAINTIASDTSVLPLQVFERAPNGDKTPLNHPVSSLLTGSPDGESPSIRVRAALMGHVLGWGNGYMEIVRRGDGSAAALYLLDPARTRAERRPDGQLIYVLGDGRSLSATNIIHVAGLGFDGLTGYTPCSLLRNTLSIATAADEFSASYFQNASHPKGYLKLKNSLRDETAVNRLRDGWDALHSGPSNAGRVAVLENGSEYVALAVRPEDAQLLATRQFSVLEICRIFRLPPHKLGDLSNSHYNNIEAANLDYLQTSLMFWLESIEAEFTRKLFKPSESNLFVEHNVDALLRGAVRERTEHYREMFALGVYTQNDILRKENMNSIGSDGDKRYVTKQIGEVVSSN